jgi:hypothetical protein
MKSNKIDGKVVRYVGKGAHEEDLQSRFSRETLTPGTLMQRAQNYYGKKMRPQDVEQERMMRQFGMDVSGPYS